MYSLGKKFERSLAIDISRDIRDTIIQRARYGLLGIGNGAHILRIYN
jgi:hypothetical protein